MIEGLWHLDNLSFLDVSHNNIEAFDPNELPSSLKVLRVAGNPCAVKLKDPASNERKELLEALPWLQTLDDETITYESRRRCGLEVVDSDEEDLTVEGLADFGEKLGLNGTTTSSLEDTEGSIDSALESAVKELHGSMASMMTRLKATTKTTANSMDGNRGFESMEKKLQELRALSQEEISRRVNAKSQ